MKNARALLFSATVLLAAGCDYMDPKDAGRAPSPPSSAGTGGSGPTAQSATFQAVFSQILVPQCLSCHAGSTAPNLSSWAAFAEDTRYVLPGNPAQSDVYVQTSSGSMPKRGNALSQGQLTLLYDWIEQGALND